MYLFIYSAENTMKMFKFNWFVKIALLTFWSSFLLSKGDVSNAGDQKFNTDRSSDPLFQDFYDFAVKNNRSYVSNFSELLKRFEVFTESLERAKLLNYAYGENSPPVYGVNKFADMTPEEFKVKYLSGLQKRASHLKTGGEALLYEKHHPFTNISALPKSIDWRQKSALSPVNDQKSCGACWAFSVAETMESMLFIQNFSAKVPSLSVQEFIDCDAANKGCSGGDICQAAGWAQQVGIGPESSYPTTYHTGACRKFPSSVKRVKVTDYSCKSLKGQELTILQTLALHGPVAVSVDASTWHNYMGGIIQFHCSQHINHAVQIVGYNLNADVPYYIIRNSWGSDFGDRGFVYVKYGEDLCGIATEVVQLTVSPEM